MDTRSMFIWNKQTSTVLFLFLLIKLGKPQDSYTPQELELLPLFRGMVKSGATQAYMIENKYLVRFLRAGDHNLHTAEKLIKENFKWRKDNDIDNFLTRDFSYYENRYPILYSYDRRGRPASSSAIGHINPRKLLLNGKHDELRDYFLYLYEKGVNFLHKVSNETGKEFIEIYLVADMAGYNVRTHACLPCITGWIEIALGYERHYPQLAYKIIVVNTPKIFDNVFQILKPLITKHTREAIVIYGYNRDEWSKFLFKLFEKNQLLPEFGGTAKFSKPVPK